MRHITKFGVLFGLALLMGGCACGPARESVMSAAGWRQCLQARAVECETLVNPCPAAVVPCRSDR